MREHIRKISNRRLCLILDAAMLLALAVFVIVMLTHTPKHHYDVDRSQYPIKGIDISAHNGSIDFDRVAADSVTFVIIKATEGTDFCDARFSVNYQEACEAGLDVGAYHFFRFDTPGSIQAAHFLAAVEGRTFQLPLMIDVERWGNPAAYDTESVKANLRAMVEAVKATGHPVAIYTNRQGYNNFIAGDFDDMPLWICALSSPPVFTNWSLWQHSHEDRVDGINGHVDANTYHGDADDYRRWLHPYTVAAINTMEIHMQ